MLTLPLQLTHAQAQASLSDWLRHADAEPGGTVKLDAKNVQHFDSSALAVLLALRRELVSRGQTLVLEEVPPRLSELAALYGVDELLGLPAAHSSPATAG